MNITVQSDPGNGCLLTIKGLVQKDISIWPIENHDDYQFYPTVTAHEARWFVKQALAQGWEHERAGSNFVLQATNEVFGHGFLAADSANQAD